MLQMYFCVYLGTTVITSIVFWTSNLLFISLDLFGFPSSLLKYKVQEEKKVPYVCSHMTTDSDQTASSEAV